MIDGVSFYIEANSWSRIKHGKYASKIYCRKCDSTVGWSWWAGYVFSRSLGAACWTFQFAMCRGSVLLEHLIRKGKWKIPKTDVKMKLLGMFMYMLQIWRWIPVPSESGGYISRCEEDLRESNMRWDNGEVWHVHNFQFCRFPLICHTELTVSFGLRLKSTFVICAFVSSEIQLFDINIKGFPLFFIIQQVLLRCLFCRSELNRGTVSHVVSPFHILAIRCQNRPCL